MPRNNNSSKTRDEYLKGITHPRKKELATMILDGASVEDLNVAEFGRLNILEAARDIKRNVEGFENLSYDIPRGEGRDSTTKEEVAATAPDAEAEKKDSPTAQEDAFQASVPAQPVGDSGPEVKSPNESTMTDTEHTAPDGKEVPGVDADDATAHPTETLGGNPVGTLTGEEDAETLQRKADEEAEVNKGDAAA